MSQCDIHFPEQQGTVAAGQQLRFSSWVELVSPVVKALRARMQRRQTLFGSVFSPGDGPDDIVEWRELVLAKILAVVSVLGFLAAMPSIFFALSLQQWHIATIDVIALAWVVTLWRWPSLSFRTRAWSFSLMLYMLGVALMTEVGLISQIYLLCFPVMVAIFLGLRPAMFALVLSSVSLFGLGYLSAADAYAGATAAHHLGKWIVFTINFSFVGAVITVSIAVLLDGLEKSLERKRDSEALYRITFDRAPIGVSRLDLTGHWLQVNSKLCEITGYSSDEMLLLRDQDITVAQDRQPDPSQHVNFTDSDIEISENVKRYRRKDGTRIWVNLRTSLVRDGAGRPKYYIAAITDITERKQSQEKIQELAYFDQLTGLPNKAQLLDQLQQAVADSACIGSLGALLLIDLDDFKALNDTLGHGVGDLLLKQVAQRLSATVRSGISVSRLGGDEFVVMLTHLGSAVTEATASVEAFAAQLLGVLNQTYQLNGVAHRSTPSIGVTLFSGGQVAVDTLLKRVDLAMYRAKAGGRNGVCFFDPDMENAAIARATLEVDLRQAIEEKQFYLCYQAQVTGDGGVAGAEVLVRWLHPSRGLVMPGEFIAVAEETGLILGLGNWVLETACAQLAQWAQRPGREHLVISVNVSAFQIHQPDFVDQVLALISRTGANPKRLKLELTESLLVSNVEDVIVKMAALKAIGVGFSLDDFGTGYSSLTYLKRLPLAELKIDQSFVRDVLLTANDIVIAKAIISLANSMGLSVIAEGVETLRQRDLLAAADCHVYQGYLFSRPLPIEAFEKYLQSA